MNKIKLILSKIIDFDNIKQFYYPLSRDKIKLRLNKSKFKFLGKRTFIDYPVKIKGMGNVYIGNDVVINSFVHIWGHGGVYIGDRVMIAANTIITSVTHDYNNKIMRYGSISKAQVIIEEDVWIGSSATILPGISIGKGSVIGAGAVVTKNIPPYSIAIGNPARIIKQRKIL